MENLPIGVNENTPGAPWCGEDIEGEFEVCIKVQTSTSTLKRMCESELKEVLMQATKGKIESALNSVDGIEDFSIISIIEV